MNPSPHQTPQEVLLLQAAGIEEVQRLVAITALGMCRALALGTLSPAYACSRFLGPALLSRIEAMRVHPELHHAIHLATELEDVARLAPEALPRSITEIEDKLLAVLVALPSPPSEDEKWLTKPPLQDA